MTPAQCRAARALLDWSQQALSDASGVGIVTVRQFESGTGVPRSATVEALMNSLEAAGVEFLAGQDDGIGLRVKGSANTQWDFLAFLKLYERSRLRSLARHCQPSPAFGYAFVYTDRDGADLMFQGALLGKVRWRDGAVTFDPPIGRVEGPVLSDTVFDRWVSLAEHRHATSFAG